MGSLARRRTSELVIVIRRVPTTMYSDRVIDSDSRGVVGRKKLVQKS